MAEIVKELKERALQGYQYEGRRSEFRAFGGKNTWQIQDIFRPDQTIRSSANSPRSKARSILRSSKSASTGRRASPLRTAKAPYTPWTLRSVLRFPNFTLPSRRSRWTDFKVRVLDSDKATAAKVRVLITSANASDSWTTVGVSEDVIEASWIALTDSIDYALMKQ